MKKWLVSLMMVYIVSWKAVGMGEKTCDYNVYTGEEVHCEKQDVAKTMCFNTRASADDFVKGAPSKGVKDMVVEEKDQACKSSNTFTGFIAPSWGVISN